MKSQKAKNIQDMLDIINSIDTMYFGKPYADGTVEVWNGYGFGLQLKTEIGTE